MAMMMMIADESERKARGMRNTEVCVIGNYKFDKVAAISCYFMEPLQPEVRLYIDDVQSKKRMGISKNSFFNTIVRNCKWDREWFCYH